MVRLLLRVIESRTRGTHYSPLCGCSKARFLVAVLCTCVYIPYSKWRSCLISIDLVCATINIGY